MDTTEWEAAGIYDPSSPASEGRRAILEYLSGRGVTLEQLVAAAAVGHLPALAGELLWDTEDLETVEELAARCGASPDMVRRVLVAVGLPVEEGGRVPASLDALISAFVQGVALMGERPTLAFTRTIGAAATSVAEAAVALFYAELGPGTGREGHDELERAHMAERAYMAFSVVPEALSRALVAQFHRASLRATVVRGWGENGLGPESETVALGFVDLVGSTAWAASLDLREQSLALSRFESVAWSSAVLAGGRVVKMIGDEVFFAAPSLDAACGAAIQIVAEVAQDPGLPPARGAVGWGLATAREGDYFGPLVNLVSRLVKSAAPGSVLVGEDSVGALASARFEVRPLGPRELRGFDTPVGAFEVSERPPA